MPCVLRQAIARLVPGRRIFHPDVIDRAHVGRPVERADGNVDLGRAAVIAVREWRATVPAKHPMDARR